MCREVLKESRGRVRVAAIMHLLEGTKELEVGTGEGLAREGRQLVPIDDAEDECDGHPHLEGGIVRLLVDQLTDGTLEDGSVFLLRTVCTRFIVLCDPHRLSTLLHEPACDEVEDLLLLCFGEPVVLCHVVSRFPLRFIRSVAEGIR